MRIRILLPFLFVIASFVLLVAVAAGNPAPKPNHKAIQHRVHVAPLIATTTSTTTTSTTTTTAPPPVVTTTTPPPAPEQSAPTDLYAAWTRVAICEEGGWVGSSGPLYPNSLGLTATNWHAFGGGDDVSPEAQIAVAERFRAAYGIPIPDQNGCAAW